MEPIVDRRIRRAALCGLFQPSEVFENNSGLVNLTTFYYILSDEETAKKLEGISKLQEEVFIYREKVRTIYKLETEDKLIINIPREIQLLDENFSKVVNELLINYKLMLTEWDIKHKFSEWQTARGLRIIGLYADYLYMKYTK